MYARCGGPGVTAPNQDVYTQAINIVYSESTAQRATTQTGFFAVGQAQVGDRQYLPLVVRYGIGT